MGKQVSNGPPPPGPPPPAPPGPPPPPGYVRSGQLVAGLERLLYLLEAAEKRERRREGGA